MIADVLALITGIAILALISYLGITELKKLQNDERKR